MPLEPTPPAGPLLVVTLAVTHSTFSVVQSSHLQGPPIVCCTGTRARGARRCSCASGASSRGEWNDGRRGDGFGDGDGHGRRTLGRAGGGDGRVCRGRRGGASGASGECWSGAVGNRVRSHSVG